MESGALELIARIEAVVLTVCGLFLIFLDIKWSAIGRMPVREVPGFAIGGAMRSIDRFVVFWFEQSERNVATAGIFTLLIFIAIPIAALLNWLRGGSALLLFILLICILGIVALAVLSEMKRARILSRALSAFLFVVVFLFVPSYVFVFLTDRALTMPIGYGVLTSILLTPLLYLVCHNAVLLFAGLNAVPTTSLQATRTRRLATLFAAVLPFVYLATFVSVLVWHLLLSEGPLPMSWHMLLVAMLCGALGTAVAIHLATPDRRGVVPARWVAARLAGGLVIGFLLAEVIRLASGQPYAAPYVPAVLPLVVPLMLVVLVALALCVKTVLAVVGTIPRGEIESERPYRVAGVLLLLLAAVAGWASLAL